jgi:hypothetical protein
MLDFELAELEYDRAYLVPIARVHEGERAAGRRLPLDLDDALLVDEADRAALARAYVRCRPEALRGELGWLPAVPARGETAAQGAPTIASLPLHGSTPRHTRLPVRGSCRQSLPLGETFTSWPHAVQRADVPAIFVFGFRVLIVPRTSCHARRS